MFPLGSIQATGWLKDQLELSANSLAGHEFEFYRYVVHSTWLGGTYEYSELHESAPYWFNYIVPLAWTLDDPRLKQQAKDFLDYVLDHQAADGWLGPETTRQTRGIWARSLLLFGLTQYAEADSEETERIVTAMHKFVKLTNSMLKDNFTGLIEQKDKGDDFDPYKFGLSRTHELPVSLQWLYENYPRGNKQLIWETMELMFEGGRVGNLDWTTFFVDGVFPKQGTGTFKTSGFTHGVNLVEGLRYPTVLYRMNGNDSLVKQTYDAVNMTIEYQGARSGTIIADEHLGGQSPQRGSELCMAVESMFSYSYLYRFHGANRFADRAELAAFNALPAAISPDWWSHQYVTQTNQPWSRNLTQNPFFNVVSYANTFGLEPNFPCCTVNHPQGYPKFTASSFVKNNDGITHMLLAPTTLSTTVNGNNIKIACDTNYPFSGRLKYEITSGQPFSLSVRIPEWALSSSQPITYQMNSDPTKNSSANSEGLAEFLIQPGCSTLAVNLPLDIRVFKKNNTVSVYRGPLLYALSINYNSTRHQPLNWADRNPLANSQVDPGHTYDYALEPTSPWKFAVDPDPSALSVGYEYGEDAPLPNPIFAMDAPPTFISADAYPIDWPVDEDTAAWPPVNPLVDPSTKLKIKLVPYGAAKLHIAEFPIAKLQG